MFYTQKLVFLVQKFTEEGGGRQSWKHTLGPGGESTWKQEVRNYWESLGRQVPEYYFRNINRAACAERGKVPIDEKPDTMISPTSTKSLGQCAGEGLNKGERVWEQNSFCTRQTCIELLLYQVRNINKAQLHCHRILIAMATATSKDNYKQGQVEWQM